MDELDKFASLPSMPMKKDTKTIAQMIRDACVTEGTLNALAPKLDRMEQAETDAIFETYVEANRTNIELDDATAAELGRLAATHFLGTVVQRKLSAILKNSTALYPSLLSMHDQREECLAFLYVSYQYRKFANKLAATIKNKETETCTGSCGPVAQEEIKP